jgi:hypothetical protein
MQQCVRTKLRLLDHLVAARASSVCGTSRLSAVAATIDQIELGWLLDRDIARFRPAQNLADKVSSTPEQVREVWSVGHQTACIDFVPTAEHRFNAVCRSLRIGALPANA